MARRYRVDLVITMPPSIPRYLMGVGFPPDLLEGIARGVDLFDCVAATRNGRHGTAWLPTGRVNVRSAAFKGSRAALDGECDCETCTTFPRGYLRHLFMAWAMRWAVDAGRAAFLAGRMPRREVAVPSSPTRGMLAQ